jgi:hypothetical protein
MQAIQSITSAFYHLRTAGTSNASQQGKGKKERKQKHASRGHVSAHETVVRAEVIHAF